MFRSDGSALFVRRPLRRVSRLSPRLGRRHHRRDGRIGALHARVALQPGLQLLGVFQMYFTQSDGSGSLHGLRILQTARFLRAVKLLLVFSETTALPLACLDLHHLFLHLLAAVRRVAGQERVSVDVSGVHAAERGPDEALRRLSHAAAVPESAENRQAAQTQGEHARGGAQTHGRGGGQGIVGKHRQLL